jgi:hypothetical protein
MIDTLENNCEKVSRLSIPNILDENVIKDISSFDQTDF